MKLDRVTITGADDSINPAALFNIAEEFPFVEWGILLSRNSAGEPRFPTLGWIEKLMNYDSDARLLLAGHLCGGWVRELCAGDLTWTRERPSIARCFQRIQLNFHAIAHQVKPALLANALGMLSCEEVILQLDGVNDGILASLQQLMDLPRLAPLYDISGGAGILPGSWPAPIAEYSGYAGGLSPDNLEDQLKLIATAAGDNRIWIDVETHVRSRNNQQFDLAKVRRFLTIARPHVRTWDDEVRS